MPHRTFVEIPEEEQAQRLAVLRRARSGDLLALHILLWCATGHNPTEIAVVLFCSRSSVYRTVRADQEGRLCWEHDAPGRLIAPAHATGRLPTLQRSLLALLKAHPRAYGWCRTRWSGATLALTLHAKRGIAVSAETMRRWLHELGWVWTRATLVAKDNDPHRMARRARIRYVFEPLKRCEAMVFADELDIPLLPKVGCAWMPKGTQLAVMTPGQNQQHSLAGALDLATGTLLYCLGPRKTNALVCDLLNVLHERYPAERSRRLSGVIDHDPIHKAKAVAQWLAHYPRCTRLFWPTDCPHANPLERAVGDVHDCCPRHHQRKRLSDLVADVEDPIRLYGPWPYKRSARYDAPAVTAAVEQITAEEYENLAA
jgi:transposase